MKDDFFGGDYEEPKAGGDLYMKLEDGANKILVLAGVTSGYEYWTAESKPVRSLKPFEGIPKDIKMDKDGKPTKAKHFWAFPVWNYAAEQVQILQVTQKGIKDGIKAYVANSEWGSPVLSYTLTIDRTGKGLETRYNVMANPQKGDHDKKILDAWAEESKELNMEELFFGSKEEEEK